MGGVVSSGHNNDDLIDNLLEADYIKSSIIERVFRAVDRAEYFLPEARVNAYKDLAWKTGNLHLSAPCIYSEVMEGLCLEPGLTFLNLGSGTGYLSTMVGLVLGSRGVNHGIEYYSDVILYANKKLEEFKKHSGAIDEFDFCEPKFIQGNCLCLTSDYHAQYDRVYCGAACPDQYETYMKNLLKIGGVLVMPLNDQLVQMKRTSETNWEVTSLLPVSFAALILPPADVQEWVQMIEVESRSLQSLSRSVIRNILRKNVEIEHPPIKRVPPVTTKPRKKRALRRLVVPLFDSDDSSDDQRQVRIGGVRNRDAGRATFREEGDGLLNLVLGTFREGRQLFSGPENNRSDNNDTEQSSEDNRMETDTTESTEESDKKLSKIETQVETHAVIEHNPSTSHTHGEPNERKTKKVPKSVNKNVKMQEECSLDSINDYIVDVLNVLRDRGEGNILDDIENNEHEEHQVQVDQRPTSSDHSDGKRNKKREKFDSGLGDEIVENNSDSSENQIDMKLDVISSSDNDEEQTEKRNKRGSKAGNDTRNGMKWRRIGIDPRRYMPSDTDSSETEEEEEEEIQLDTESLMCKSSYTVYMRTKIQELPLPPILKRYLNYYREF